MTKRQKIAMGDAIANKMGLEHPFTLIYFGLLDNGATDDVLVDTYNEYITADWEDDEEDF